MGDRAKRDVLMRKQLHELRKHSFSPSTHRGRMAELVDDGSTTREWIIGGAKLAFSPDRIQAKHACADPFFAVVTLSRMQH